MLYYIIKKQTPVIKCFQSEYIRQKEASFSSWESKKKRWEAKYPVTIGRTKDHWRWEKNTALQISDHRTVDRVGWVLIGDRYGGMRQVQRGSKAPAENTEKGHNIKSAVTKMATFPSAQLKIPQRLHWYTETSWKETGLDSLSWGLLSIWVKCSTQARMKKKLFVSTWSDFI